MEIYLAFLLLDQERHVDREAIVAAMQTRGMKAAVADESRSTAPADGDVFAIALGDDATLHVAPIAAPVPAGEAEAAVEFSLSSMGTGWTLAAHRAHLIVTMTDQRDVPPIGCAGLWRLSPR